MKTEIEKEREKIIKEIEAKKIELEQLDLKEKMGTKLKSSAIKDLSEFTDFEKCELFDNLYNSALSSLNTCIENEGYNDDDEHYAWEEHMEILARDSESFWDYFNSITN